MVKTEYRTLCELPTLRDVLHRSPSSPSNLVDSSENEMDTCMTPDSGGSGTDGNGGLVHTMSRRCHLESSSPAGSQLMAKFDATTNDRGSGSSPPLLSSTSRDLELDESHNNNNIRSGGGSSRGSNNRRNGFGGQFYQWREDYRRPQFLRNSRYHELGSSSRRHAQPLPPFPSNIQQGQQQYTYNNMQLPAQYPHHMTPPAYMVPWVAPASPPSYTYAPAMVSIPPAVYYPPHGIRRPGVYPPPGITIRHPGGTLPPPPPPPPPRRSETPVVIRAPPADEAGTSAPKQPETPPPLPPPGQPETETPPPAPEQPELTSGQESFVLEVLYGPSTSGRPRLPVFRDICPDDDAGQALPPPPPCA